MTSRERLTAIWHGRPADRVPLTTWCFGLPAPKSLRWQRDGREVRYWYSLRMEHLHTFPEPWGLEDDFARVRAWQSLGVDDTLEVSVPWTVDPEVVWEDEPLPAAGGGGCGGWVRTYHTPAGDLRHAVRRTEPPGPGWVVQPESVPLFEDYNIPRAVEHAVAGPADVPAARHLYRPPDAAAEVWFADRMQTVGRFAGEAGVPVVAWAAFGMDAAVWLAGPEGAVLLAVDAPGAFSDLLDAIAETDLARIAVAARHPEVDLVVQRGWYSATDFWSPRLFDQFVVPHVAEAARLAHRHGKPFGYVMTTGVEVLGPRLAEAGVDVLFFVDPVQDGLPPERAAALLGGRMALVGGTNALTLASGDLRRIREEVRHAVDVLAPTGRFVLHPVDALFPDTPWEGVVAMVEAWKEALQ